MDCNAATRNVPPWLCGGGESGIPAADCRDACCRLSGILLPIVGMPAAVLGDAWNESCWCLALYKNRHWNEAKEASEQSVESTLINWKPSGKLKIERLKPSENIWQSWVWKIFYIFSEENCKNIWWFQKLVVPLQRWKWRVKVKREESSPKAPTDCFLTSHLSPLTSKQAGGGDPM